MEQVDETGHAEFARLQERLRPLFERILPDLSDKVFALDTEQAA